MSNVASCVHSFCEAWDLVLIWGINAPERDHFTQHSTLEQNIAALWVYYRSVYLKWGTRSNPHQSPPREHRIWGGIYRCPRVRVYEGLCTTLIDPGEFKTSGSFSFVDKLLSMEAE